MVLVRRLLATVLLVLVLAPFGVSSALAASSPTPNPVKWTRDGFITANPALSRFTLEIDGLTPTDSALTAFEGWYVADPTAVLAFLAYLQGNPAVANQIYQWVAANPAAATALFQIFQAKKIPADWL